MATKEEQETLRLLVQHVSRAFYEPKFVVIMDQLARHPVLKDDDLAGRIGLQSKELNKIMAVLSGDRLVMVHRQNELKEGAQRSIGRQYYYIDYQHFCNVVKWRVAEMRRVIDSGLRNELENKGYICPNCSATFAPLEVDRLMDFLRGAFICDQCSTSPSGPSELIENENAESVRGSNDRMERFNKQTRWIRDGLKRSEEMILPAFDVSIWIKQNIPTTAPSSTAAATPGAGLKIAGSTPSVQDDGIGVLMSVDTDEATQRAQRQRDAEARRAQNKMPEWHLKSTISGELTALGHAANGHSVANGDSNAAILDSLGSDRLVGLGKMKVAKKEKPGMIRATVTEDVKPVIDREAEYYDQYYASLEASSQSQLNTQNTNTPQLQFDDDFEFDEEPEERKPNIAYLDSLPSSQWSSQYSLPPSTSNSRKRSRERDDLGPATEKALKLNSGTPVYSRSNSYSHSNGGTEGGGPDEPVVYSMETPLQVDEGGGGSTAGLEDDPVVYVAGKPMPFSQVTQEIADESMSAEEYTAWYELLMAQSS